MHLGSSLVPDALSSALGRGREKHTGRDGRRGGESMLLCWERTGRFVGRPGSSASWKPRKDGIATNGAFLLVGTRSY